MVDIGHTLNNRYRLLSLEGKGGMATVYKAQDLKLKRLVAVKVLHATPDGVSTRAPSADDAFQREAQAAARVPHPNVVTVYDVGQDQDVSYIVMEYVQGPTLRDLIVAEAPFGVGRTMDIAIQICNAVDFIHNHGVIHCDLKPLNIMVLPDGQVKITDFGIARDLSAAATRQPGKAWGTTHYVSPELIAGKPLTPASDVYAIGIILYEMLTGVRPFDGATAAEIARQHVLDAPPPIQQHNPRVPRYVRQVLDRALAKEPGKRYRTAGQMSKLLASYRRHGETDTQPLPVAPPAARPGRAPIAPPAATASPPASAKFDWPILMLGLLAFVAVMGLIPLWGNVITHALVSPTPLPAPTSSLAATPTPTNANAAPSTVAPPPTITPQELVAAPDLVGKSITETRQLAQDNRLTLVIIEQQYHLDVPNDHIISQNIVPGEQVAPNSEIGVVTSLGPPIVVMPNSVGFPAKVQKLDLQDLGLNVFITATASLEPEGLVIEQAPPPGVEIRAGQTVTLTVSSGPEGEIRANLDYKLALISCVLNKTTFRPGDTLQLNLTWEVLGAMSRNYKLFIHIIDSDGHIAAQRDEPPLAGERPTHTWTQGETIQDLHTLPLPTNMPAGQYEIYLGLYDGDYRMPVVDPGLAHARDDALMIGQLEIGP